MYKSIQKVQKLSCYSKKLIEKNAIDGDSSQLLMLIALFLCFSAVNGNFCSLLLSLVIGRDSTASRYGFFVEVHHRSHFYNHHDFQHQ